jgi:hypothetical protein
MRQNRAFYYLSLAALAVVLGCASEASACSCAREAAPCQSFGAAQAIFVGKVVGSKEQRREKNQDGTSTTYAVGEIYFELEEAFLGVKGPRVVIHSGTGGGDCGYWFLKGMRYLVYAYGAAPDALSTSICTRTRTLADAATDMEFLRNLPRPGTGARIFGTVAAAIKDPKKERWRAAKPLSGLTVKVVGTEKTLDAVTDSDGKYELTGLPADKYKVYAEVPDYFRRDEYWVQEFELNDRGCRQVNFFAQNDSRITGRVLRPEGGGLAKANVVLIPAESAIEQLNRTGIDQTWADKDGEYELEEIAPGRYLVGINVTSSPSAESPYPRTFYPGVADPARATVIEVGLGEKLAHIDIQLPATLLEQVVRGFVVWPNDTLAAGVEVYLEDVNHPGVCVNGCSQKTDAQGRFEFKAYSGYEYRVVALADKSEKNKDDEFGQSTSFKLTADRDGMKVVLSSTGRPWDKKEAKPNER